MIFSPFPYLFSFFQALFELDFAQVCDGKEKRKGGKSFLKPHKVFYEFYLLQSIWKNPKYLKLMMLCLTSSFSIEKKNYYYFLLKSKAKKKRKKKLLILLGTISKGYVQIRNMKSTKFDTPKDPITLHRNTILYSIEVISN